MNNAYNAHVLFLKSIFFILAACLLLSCEDNQADGNIYEKVTNYSNDDIINMWGIDFSIKNTKVIDLRKNQIPGAMEIPSKISKLKNLTQLNLSWNKLKGEIPSEIGLLTNLIILNLEGNQIEGEIPQSISELTLLENLNLSWNKLSGSVPSNISYLTNLKSLSFAYNDLNGEIPDLICDLNINFDENWCDDHSSFEFIENNKFCPPYPSCIVSSIGKQDLSNCN